MAKKPGEAFAMSDEDEFIENSSSEGGSEDGTNNNEGGQDDSGDGTGRSESDGSGDGGSSKKEGEGAGKSGTETGSEAGKSGEEGTGEEDAGDTSGKGSETASGETGTGKEGEGSKEGGKTGDGDKAGEGEAEIDIFADLASEEGTGEEGQSSAVSFKKLGSALNIELESDSEEEFTKKVNEKIEAAKQQVDLSKFDPKAQRLVKHLNENEGELGDFFVNPKITELNSVLSMPAEEKFKMLRFEELKKTGETPEEINQKIEEEMKSMSAQRIVDVAKKIDSDVKKMVEAEIEEIIGEREKRVEQDKAAASQKAQERREKLKNFVHNKSDFLGLQLSEKAKSAITRDIETGRFDEMVKLDDDEAMFAAYMIKRSGGKIAEQFTRTVADSSREGYNKGLDKMAGKLHKNKDDAQGTGTGHQETSGEKKNFDNWGTLDL